MVRAGLHIKVGVLESQSSKERKIPKATGRGNFPPCPSCSGRSLMIDLMNGHSSIKYFLGLRSTMTT